MQKESNICARDVEKNGKRAGFSEIIKSDNNKAIAFSVRSLVRLWRAQKESLPKSYPTQSNPWEIKRRRSSVIDQL